MSAYCVDFTSTTKFDAKCLSAPKLWRKIEIQDGGRSPSLELLHHHIGLLATSCRHQRQESLFSVALAEHWTTATVDRLQFLQGFVSQQADTVEIRWRA